MGYTTCLGMCGSGAGTGGVEVHRLGAGILLVHRRGLSVSLVVAVGAALRLVAGVPFGFASILATAAAVWACAWLVACEFTHIFASRRGSTLAESRYI